MVTFQLISVKVALFLTVFFAGLLFGETFNVGYDATLTPQLSGPGGTLPAPSGLPYVSDLNLSSGNVFHVDTWNTLWMDSYQSGDYFSFSLLDGNSDNTMTMNGIWFSVLGGGNGPDVFRVEMWSNGSMVDFRETLDAGVFVWGTDWSSFDNSAEIRIVGIGGNEDPASGVFESFGVDFILSSFTVVPEPATILLFGLGGFGAWLLRRNGKSQVV